METNVKNGHPAPGLHPYPSQTTVLHGCGLSSEWGSALPRSQQERSHTRTHQGQACSHSPTARLAVLTGVHTGHHHGPPPPLSPGEKQTLFWRSIILSWRSQGPWKSPSQELREATPHPLSRCPLGTSRLGMAWEYVSPGEWRGPLGPLTTDSLRSSLLHRPAEPRTHEGAGVSTSRAERPGALPGGQAGQDGGTTPATTQTRGGEELRPASSRKKPQPAWGESQSASPGPGPGRGRLCARLCSSLWFFSLNGGSW